MKTTLTDRAIKAAKSDLSDSLVPGLALRVTPTGAKIFILISRFPGSTNPTRRTLGVYGVITLDEARTKARAWIEQIARGVDPAGEVERIEREGDRRRRDTFAHIAEAYIGVRVIGRNPAKPLFRHPALALHNIRNILVPLFGKLPAADITMRGISPVFDDIAALGTDRAMVKHRARTELLRPHATAKGSVEQSRGLFNTMATILQWAAEVDEYGFTVSPLASVRQASKFGERTPRERVLNDDELAAAWRSTGKMHTPARQAYRMLILTGLRRREVTDAHWSEFNLQERLWTIPKSRMKARNTGGKARDHRVPLTNLMLATLSELPRFDGRGDYVFSMTLGATPYGMNMRIKHKLDEEMAAELKVREVPHFVNHDLRRTLRTRIRKLGVPIDVAEQILAHRRKGMEGVYDHDDRLEERRAAHDKWDAFVTGIAHPPTDKVVPLRKVAGQRGGRS